MNIFDYFIKYFQPRLLDVSINNRWNVKNIFGSNNVLLDNGLIYGVIIKIDKNDFSSELREADENIEDDSQSEEEANGVLIEILLDISMNMC